jgi:predicted porin
VFATVGKNWSTYYQVSSFTDKFQGAGGSASGTYNAGTDGGSTGTGRADRVLQTRSSFKITPKLLPAKPFRINAQFQYGEPIPAVDGATYGLTVGLSAVYELQNDFEVGLAYNHANVQRLNDPVVKAAGLEGDAQALVLGARWFNDRWYVATVVSRLLNHETTDENIYFDGTGWELYSQYQFHGPWYVVGGWNILEPDSGQPRAGVYRVKYGVAGVRYTFDQFRRMLYFNVRLDDGRATDGDTAGDIYTVGVRWDFP